MSSTTNIDNAEIEKFARLAAAWWDPAGPLKSLHDINPLRVGFVADHALLEGRKVLDVGCGGGILSEAMARLGGKVTGIDASAEAVGAARFHAGQGVETEYRKSTAEAFAAHSREAFDVVTCMELLEHVPEPASLVSACASLVRPGGSVFFATLNRNPKSYLFAILGAELLLGLLPRGTHRWRRFVKPSELDRWAVAAGLQRQARTGLHYNPFTRRYRLGGSLDVNYLAAYLRTKNAPQP